MLSDRVQHVGATPGKESTADLVRQNNLVKEGVPPSETYNTCTPDMVWYEGDG